MVAEGWMGTSKQIEIFSVGHACRILNDMTAGVAIRGIQSQMREIQRNAGLQDASLNLSEYTDTAMRAGAKDAALALNRPVPTAVDNMVYRAVEHDAH